jgi:heme/copper-type cytochrome/quinol oxidase subunit 3
MPDTYDAHKSATEVRQGSRTLDNFWVLLISLGSIVVIFAVIFAIYLAATPPAVVTP